MDILCLYSWASEEKFQSVLSRNHVLDCQPENEANEPVLPLGVNILFKNFFELYWSV